MNRIYVFLLLVVSMYSCNSLYYQTDFLKEVNPHEYQSYYIEGQCDDDVNAIVEQRIQNAIDVNARKLGYAPDNNGDLLVKYLIKNTSERFVEECVKEYGRFDGGEICRLRVVTYKEGALIMDFIDVATNEIVWHGAAYGPSFNDWKDADTKINDMVSTLFERYYSMKK